MYVDGVARRRPPARPLLCCYGGGGGRQGGSVGVGAPKGGAEAGVLPGEAVCEGRHGVGLGAKIGDEAPECGEGGVIVELQHGMG
jgi:hypothetical protein